MCSLWWNHGKKTSPTSHRKWLCKQGCCLYILWWGCSSKKHEGMKLVQPVKRLCKVPLSSRTKISIVQHYRGWHRGLLETEKPHKKSPKTAKPQEISSKTENRIKLLTHKVLVAFRISLSVINFYTYKLILLSEFLSGYFLVSAEHNVV